MRILLALAILALVAAPATAAELTAPTVSYTGLDDESTFVFQVAYKGEPAVPSVVIDGASYAMLEVDHNDQNYSDGKAFYYETQLPAGTTIYHFECGNLTSAAKLILVDDANPAGLEHLDVMFAVLIFVPFALYFAYLARKAVKALERKKDK